MLQQFNTCVACLSQCCQVCGVVFQESATGTNWFHHYILLRSAALHVQDMGSETSVTVDGNQVSKNEEVQLKIGSEICFGSETVYQVSAHVHK